MKKLLFALIISIAAISPIFAYTDTFYSTSTDPDYVYLISAIKNNLPEDTVLGAYNKYINGGKTPVEVARVEYHIAKYFKDNKQKKTAESHIELMRQLIDAIPVESISDFEKRILEIEYHSAKYHVDKKLSEGMENSKLTKEVYELYPDDVLSILLNSWRLVYTPAIAGGSPKKGIRAVNDLLKNYKDKMADLDIYSAYSCLAIGYNMRDDYQNADKYFKEAFKYFDKEADMVEAYNENIKAMNEIDE